MSQRLRNQHYGCWPGTRERTPTCDQRERMKVVMTHPRAFVHPKCRGKVFVVVEETGFLEEVKSEQLSLTSKQCVEKLSVFLTVTKTPSFLINRRRMPLHKWRAGVEVDRQARAVSSSTVRTDGGRYELNIAELSTLT